VPGLSFRGYLSAGRVLATGTICAAVLLGLLGVAESHLATTDTARLDAMRKLLQSGPKGAAGPSAAASDDGQPRSLGER